VQTGARAVRKILCREATAFLNFGSILTPSFSGPISPRFPKRILALVIKNTSTIDFFAPILWALRRMSRESSLSVYFASISRRKILRHSAFYDTFFSALRIAVYDQLDFTIGIRPLAGSLRRLIAVNDWDVLTEGTERDGLERWWVEMATYLEYLAKFFVRPESVLNRLGPETVLFDNRTRTEPLGREHMYRELLGLPGTVFLLPHAPHNTRSDEFIPFDAEGGIELPPNSEYWVTLREERPWEGRSGLDSRRFRTVGYPGLDSAWLNWLGSFHSGAGRSRKTLRLLFIIRAYSGRWSGRAEEQSPDPFILSEPEFRSYIRLLRDAIRLLGERVVVTVKPHPSNNFRTLSMIFAEEGVKDWRVSYEPIYAEVSSTDLVVALYSTILLVPAMMGIPTALLQTPTQEFVNQWEPLERLYKGMPFYLSEPAYLVSVLPEMVAIARARRAGERQITSEKQVEHLRTFFPDGAIETCLERIAAGAPRLDQ